MSGKRDAAERSRLGIEPEFRPWDEERDGPIPKPGGILEAGGRKSERDENKKESEKHWIERCETADLGSGDIAEELSRAELSVANLPVWDGPEGRGGMGEEFNESLGGGLGPRRFILIGGRHAGAGKTSFAMQLVHGLAMRNASLEDSAPLTPVMVLSEMATVDLKVGMLRRWAGLRKRELKALAQGREFDGQLNARKAKQRAIDETAKGAEFMRFLPGSVDGIGGHRHFMTEIADGFARWADSLKSRPGNQHREVWPVLLIDSLQVALGGCTSDELTAQNQLAEHINAVCRSRSMIVIATCETSKASAQSKEDDEELSAMFRGSYRAIHKADVVFALGRAKGDKEAQQAPIANPKRLMWSAAVKCRDGEIFPHKSARADFRFEPAIARFIPESREDRKALELANGKRAEK